MSEYNVTITKMEKDAEDVWTIEGDTDLGPFSMTTYMEDVDYDVCPEIIGNEDANGEWVDDEPIMNAIGEYAEKHNLSWPD
jgi:hypothetical protein